MQTLLRHGSNRGVDRSDISREVSWRHCTGTTIYVAEDATGLLGLSEVHRANGCVYNAAVFVSSRASRKGVGSALYSTAECQALRAGAERIVLNSSLAAVEFYENNGFRQLHHGSSEMPSGTKMKIIRMIKHFPVNEP